MKIARRVGYALFGVLNGTEAGSHVHPELGAVLYCSIGGSLEAQEGASRQGMQSSVSTFDLSTTLIIQAQQSQRREV
ncbi:rhodanese domain-containing protein, partial [Haematococcus lacustris]